MTIVHHSQHQAGGLIEWNRNSTCWSHLPITAGFQETVPESTTNRCTKPDGFKKRKTKGETSLTSSQPPTTAKIGLHVRSHEITLTLQRAHDNRKPLDLHCTVHITTKSTSLEKGIANQGSTKRDHVRCTVAGTRRV